jgi:hypothetical protein
MHKTTIVLSSARAIRHEQLKIKSQTLFLPDFITMSEFISKLCVVKGFKSIDEDRRVLLLLEASDFKTFSSLKIQRNFFTFTKNSSYIFNFFQELSAEMCDIDELESADIYGEYEEHLSILKELYKRYEEVCLKNKFLDKIFLPKLYELNKSYLYEHPNIEIHIDGYLTNFELELLLKSCEFSSIKLVFNTSKFNKKMQQKFLDIGIELKNDYAYTISLNEKKILTQTKRVKNKEIYCESFSEALLQVAFIKQKLYEAIKDGYEAQNIAVILPNETMAQKLKSFDEKSNFNFAMGESFVYTQMYKKLDAVCKLLEQKSQENMARVEMLGDEFYMKLSPHYYKNLSEFDIVEFLEEYKGSFDVKSEIKIFEGELYKFGKILPYLNNMNVKSALNLFLQRLSSKSLDDVRGGKVTVMGVLETRSVEFDVAIIVDFNDTYVPKRSNKDMFLNTNVRQMAKLPTMKDRQNLQKHYYDLLISNSKRVYISYIDSEQESGSKFLKELGVDTKNRYDEMEYAKILFSSKKHSKKDEEDIVLEYSFRDKKLSATRLKTFLTCKRKYYYAYIKHIQSHEIPKDMPKEYEIGNVIHHALSSLYSKKNTYSSVDALKRDLEKELDAQTKESELEKYLISLQKKKMQRFCEVEIERFSKGWSVFSCERSLERTFSGIKLIGQIDRIDKRDDELYVLDYKTGSYNLYNKNNFVDAVDFQLEFYYLLSSTLGEVSGCGFYDLKEFKIVPEAFIKEKLGVLESNIKDLLNLQEINFTKCEDIKNCVYCEYSMICKREF